MLVVLDANILVADFKWASASFRLLMGERQHGRLQLAVPRLVVQETASKYAERVMKALTDAKASKGALERIGYSATLSVPEARHRDIRSGYERELLERLHRIGAEVPEYPAPSHQDVVTRLLDGRKPFGSEGKGYRDSLLWVTIVELARSRGRVVLVSQNWRDFAESSEGTTLHSDLRDDLEREGIPVDRVELFPDLTAFVKAHIEPARKVLDEIEGLLKADTEFRLHVLEEIQTAIGSQLPSGSSVDVEPFAGNPFEDPTFAHIDTFSIKDIVVEDARVSEPAEAYLFLKVRADAEIDAFVFKADLYSLPDDEIDDVTDPDWNDHYAWVHLDRTVDISLEAKYQPEMRAVSDVQVTEAEVQLRRL